MNDSLIQLFFALLRSTIRGEQLSEQERALYTDDMLPVLMAIAKKHDVSHLVAGGLKNNGFLTPEHQTIAQEILKAVYRYTRQNFEYEALCATLEAAQIQFIPLKGSVLRQWYPEPWMRTSCDIDILVHEEEVEKTATYLVEKHGYTRGETGVKDISLFSQGGMHLELHFGLLREGLEQPAYDVLNSVWDTAVVCDGYQYWSEMPDEMFYFYHIAHMAKHVVFGGCGVRTFLDLWILDHIDGADWNKRNELLKRGGLYKFAEASRLLSRVWFGDAEHETTSKQMEEFILRGGVYGNAENRIAVQQQQKGGKFKYMLSRIFLPYRLLKVQYPILQKHRWLTPAMEIRRWCALIFGGRSKRVLHEMSCNQNISTAEAAKTQAFMENIGL